MLLSFKLVKNTTKFIVCFIVILIIYYYQNYAPRYPQRRLIHKINYIKLITKSAIKIQPDLKYILIWTKDETFNFLGKGQKAFIMNKCKFNNCFVSTHRNMIYNDYSNYNAILFSGKKIGKNFVYGYHGLPKKRAREQIYIFGMQEDAITYPVCSEKFDNFFNLTWTYKLDSDIIWPYFKVLELASGKVVGPKINIKWSQEFVQNDDILSQIQKRIVDKDYYGAWLSFNCHSQSKRENLVKIIKNESEKYGNILDVVGDCGSKECEKNETLTDCRTSLYFYSFYMAFEPVKTEDFVTSEVLDAIDHYCVPVVYGGANYSRFLPPNSYIDISELGTTEAVRLMGDLMDNMTAYFDYFTWRTSYKVVRQTCTAACDLCEALNKGYEREYPNFREWWNPNFSNTCQTVHKKNEPKFYKFRKNKPVN